MKTINMSNGAVLASEISLGCMRIADLSDKDAANLIQTAVDEGINFFDHADIYAGGKSEELFAKAVDMNKIDREKLIIQTKCGSDQVSSTFQRNIY